MSRDPFRIIEKNLLILGDDEQLIVEYKWNDIMCLTKYTNIYSQKNGEYFYKSMDLVKKISIPELIRNKKNSSTVLQIVIYKDFQNGIELYPLVNKKPNFKV